MFENRMLGRVLGYKKEQVTEGWRLVHNEDFDNL
jgi:hypothetical protein